MSQQSSDQGTGAPSDPPCASPVRRALVIDDHPFIRVALKQILLQQGVEHVAEAGDGDSALVKLQAPGAAFDILFCDLQMPGRDGIETLRAIAAAGTRAGVILMSGEDEETLAAAETMARSEGLAVLGRITKPVRAADVKKFLAMAGAKS